MAIDFNGMQDGFVRTLNELVGKDACPNRQLFTSPVIKARQGGKLPKYPVVVIDKLGTEKYGISSTIDVFYDDNLFLVRHTIYKAIFTITVHGGKNDDVQSICQEIRDTLFREYGRYMLEDEVGARVLGITSPNFTFNYLKTEYEEVSQINVDMSVTDVFVEDDPNCPVTSSIESIIVNGVLKRDPDDDSTLTIEGTAP